jgi:hypothetical protein
MKKSWRMGWSMLFKINTINSVVNVPLFQSIFIGNLLKFIITVRIVYIMTIFIIIICMSKILICICIGTFIGIMLISISVMLIYISTMTILIMTIFFTAIIGISLLNCILPLTIGRNDPPTLLDPNHSILQILSYLPTINLTKRFKHTIFCIKRLWMRFWRRRF